MADNGTAASGPTVAWDDIGGVAFQRMKLAVGADGAAKDFQPATVVANAAGTGDAALVAAACTLLGWSVAETGGSTAKLYLRDGTDATGTIVATFTLNPYESIREIAPACGIKIVTGLYLDRTSGTTELSAWYAP